MISNVIRQTDNNFIFLESSHSETTASGKSVEVTSHSSQMEPHKVDNVSSPSQDPSKLPVRTLPFVSNVFFLIWKSYLWCWNEVIFSLKNTRE